MTNASRDNVTSFVIETTPLLNGKPMNEVAAAHTPTEQRYGMRAKPFPKGVSGNPAGKPKGARNKITELFMSAMRDDFAEHGREAIARLRERDPAQYLAAVRSIIPAKRIEEYDSKPAEIDSMSDAEFAAAMDDGLQSAASEQRRVKAVEMTLSGNAATVTEAMALLTASDPAAPQNGKP